jgi:hypothetical protein
MLEQILNLIVLIIAVHIVGGFIVAIAELITWYTSSDKSTENGIISRKHLTILIIGLVSMIIFDSLGMYRFPFT